MLELRANLLILKGLVVQPADLVLGFFEIIFELGVVFVELLRV